MKTKILFTVSLFLFSIISYSQKTISNTDKVFSNFEQRPIEDLLFALIGKSKFKVITTLALQTNIKEDDYNQYFEGVFEDTWDKFDYLKNDSVLRGTLYYEIIDSPSFLSKDIKLNLRFVDDILYKIDINSTFKKENFKSCLNNYYSLTKNFETDFPFAIPFTTTKQNNSKGEEQIGEGFWMYKEVDENGKIRVKEKTESLTIGYKLNYKWKLGNIALDTNEIDNYTLEIRYVNLLGTKLTREGY